MSSRQRLIVLLFAAVIFLAKHFTTFLTVGSLIEGYMLIVSTDAIVNSSLFNSSSSSISFRSDAWTMETRVNNNVYSNREIVETSV